MTRHTTPAIIPTLRLLGGMATTNDLLEAGITADRLRRAAIRGDLFRPRHGLFALPGHPEPLLQAACAGGPLAGLSAARYYGWWTPRSSPIEISVRTDSRRLAHRGLVLHHDAHLLEADERFVVSPTSAARQCIRTLSFDFAVAVLDSALHEQAITGENRVDLGLLRESLPRRLHAVVDAADERAEAGAETLARIRLRRCGIPARPQVWITRGIRIDLLLGDSVALEIGSKEFHADPERYEADHARAATIIGLGFDHLEFTTSQVMDDWETVEAVILSRVRPFYRSAGREFHQGFGATPR